MHGGSRRLDRIEDGARPRQQAVPTGKQPHPTRGPLEQRCAEFFLESANASGQRGLRHVQAPSGSPDVGLLGHRDKRLELDQRHAAIVSRDEAGLDTDWVLDRSSRARHP